MLNRGMLSAYGADIPMNTRLASLTSIAFLLVACGGRTAAFEDEDALPGTVDTGGTSTTDTGGSPDDDTSVIFDDTSTGEDVDPGVDVIDPEDVSSFDTSVPPFDSGTPTKDTGTPSKDSGTVVTDSSVVMDTTVVTDSGVVVKDTGIIVTDTGIITSDSSFDAGTLYATCAKISAATCTDAFKSCCLSKGFGYDSLGCDDVSRNWCDDAVDGVVAGKTTYNGAYADACAAAWKTMTTACTPHTFEWVKAQSACSQLFNGLIAPGGLCTRATECRALAGETAWCDDSSKRCRAYSVVGAGAACNYFGASIHWCDVGLTCDVIGGKCVKATPIGGSCFGPDDTACGIGNTCKSGKCAVGAAPGSSCVRDLECASWDCQLGKCTDIRVTVPNKALCGTI
jgi:hypothetical protein